MRKLCIGTAKFDSKDYGVSSLNDDRELATFFKTCRELSVNNFDTSPRYGDSEVFIGKYFKPNEEDFISTKIDKINFRDSNEKICSYMYKSIEKSLKNLRVDSVGLCYLHENQLEVISNKNIQKNLEELKKRGYINSIGASVYSIQELDYILKCHIYDWVQIPINILDTSFYEYVIQSSSKIKIAARSIFLQGNLINTRDFLKKKYDGLKYLLNEISLISSLVGVDLSKLMISYINSLDKIEQIVIGTTSNQNLISAVESFNIKLKPEILNKLNRISFGKKSWTNPRMWNNS